MNVLILLPSSRSKIPAFIALSTNKNFSPPGKAHSSAHWDLLALEKATPETPNTEANSMRETVPAYCSFRTRQPNAGGLIFHKLNTELDADLAAQKFQ